MGIKWQSIACILMYLHVSACAHVFMHVFCTFACLHLCSPVYMLMYICVHV